MKRKNFINKTDYFSRQETLEITKISDRKLGYLEKLEVIKPFHREGRKVYYNWYQLLELRLIVKLRNDVTLGTIREAKDYLFNRLGDEKLYKQTLVVWDKKIVLIDKKHPTDDEIRIEITGNNKGQILIYQVLPMGDVVSELLEYGRNNIVNFNERLKANNIDYSGVREAIAS